MFASLPEAIQKLAEGAFEMFLSDPNHRSLRKKTLKDSSASSHIPGSESVRVTLSYRAIFIVDPVSNINVWYWIGNQSDYDKFIG